LSWAAWQPCLSKWSALAPLFTGASTSLKPALVGGATPDVVFRGFVNNDNHLYHAQLGSAGWVKDPQLALLTDVAPWAVRLGAAVHAVHTGTDGKVYDAIVGGASIQVGTATSGKSPTAVMAGDGTLWVIFVGTDTNLYYATRASGSATFTGPTIVCAVGTCLATTDLTPSLALTAAGAPIVGFHGTDNNLYTSTWNATRFDNPIPANANGDASTRAPVLASGVGTAAAELVYVRSSDGYARHARLIGGTWGTFATVGTQALATTPALASQP
jgi:hypothetical protein